MAEKMLICSAWPYVYSTPHLGNIIPMLSADVLARYYRQRGFEVEFVSGSDEHGARFEYAAKQKNISPKEITNKHHKEIQDMIKKLNLSYTKYSRTSNTTHKKFVQEFYQKIYNNGFISFKEERLPFCESCGLFLPDRFVTGTCPKCDYDLALGNQCEKCGSVLDPIDLVNPRCSFCNEKPIIKESTNGYFELPKLESELKKYVAGRDNWQDPVKNFTLSWLNEGLKSRPITRDISWGIPAPFPETKGKTIYVWGEAVLGYMSVVLQRGDKNFKDYWQDEKTLSIFCLGKDNIPFHTIIFPALIMATKEKYNLPWQIFSNDYINWEGKKFSKTHKIGIWINEMDILNADLWRYYIFRIFPDKGDTNFKWSDMEDKINKELVANLGNFVSRTLGLINKLEKGKVPKVKEYDIYDKEVIKFIKELKKESWDLIGDLKLKEYLIKIMGLCTKGNEYLQLKKPWDGEDKNSLNVCANLCRALAIFLYPFIPQSCERLWKDLGLNDKLEDKRLDDVEKFEVEKVKKGKHLFEKINAKEIQENLGKIRKEHKNV